jgi:hypothetical protein
MPQADHRRRKSRRHSAAAGPDANVADPAVLTACSPWMWAEGVGCETFVSAIAVLSSPHLLLGPLQSPVSGRDEWSSGSQRKALILLTNGRDAPRESPSHTPRKSIPDPGSGGWFR